MVTECGNHGINYCCSKKNKNKTKKKKQKNHYKSILTQSYQTWVNLQFRIIIQNTYSYTIGSWQHFQTNVLLIYLDML